jgi:nicotinate-nucleotide adenylyltransferase
MDQPSPKSRRVAFFGGSFDPPHLGHLAVARAARAALGLDAVLFAPVGAQPLKRNGSAASFADRLAMTQLAIAGEPGFVLSFADAPQPSGEPNYTLETLLGLRDALPANGQLFCLMGADSFFSLRKWHRAAEIPFVAPLIVASRPGQQLEGLRAALPAGLTIESAPGAHQTGSGVELLSYCLRNPAAASAPFYLLPGLNVDVSATEIREQVRAASGSETAAHEVLSVAVSGYIRSHGLYR